MGRPGVAVAIVTSGVRSWALPAAFTKPNWAAALAAGDLAHH
jgi:hypothetical protein